MTLLSSVQKGLLIKETIDSRVVSTSSSSDPYTPFSLLYSSSRTSTEIAYTQTRRVNTKLRLTGGLAVSTGIKFAIKQKTFFDLQAQVGSNFINGLNQTFNYTNGKLFGKLKIMVRLKN